MTIKNNLKKITLLLILFTVNIVSFSQVLEPVKWDVSTRNLGENEVELIFKAKIDKLWHLYSQDIVMSPPATTFSFKDIKGYELLGKVAESESIEKYDANFEMKVKYFSNEAIFKQKIKLLTDSPVNVHGYVNFMCCDDKRCIPPNDFDFEFVLNSSGKAEKSGGDKEKPGATQESYYGGIADEENTPVEQKDTTSDSSLWIFFFIAIIAGFAGSLTPCVYPMIPMTVNFFMNSSKNKLQAKTNALFYGLSIIIIYTVIGVLVTVIFGAGSIKNISSNWITNLIFFLLFTTFAASFFGLFEFVLPASLTNKTDKQSDRGGYIGTFFMALTLVIVSFSCTAPFVGGILVEAATGSIIKPTIGMFGFSLAFALPFTVLALFPSWLNKLPKSGGWLNSVKVVLGFIILALGMKFLLVPNQALSWGLNREFFIAIWIVLFTLLGLYLLGKIKFAHDSDINHISVPRLLLIIITFTFVVYLIPGMFGAPLKAVSGFLPSESSFNLNEISGKSEKSTIPIDYKSNICEEPKYSELFKLPHGLQGYFDYEQGLACAKELNKPILLDFKGHACVNCKVMEKTVWSDPEVLKRLNEDFVIIALYVDDRTELPEPEWITSIVDGKVKKTIGKKNTDFQISRFNVNAQPFYVLLDHNNQLLVEPRAYDKDIEEFVEFLDKGINKFKGKK